VTAQGPPPEEMAALALGPYRVGEMVGKGAFGSVYRGLNLETGATVAIKTFNTVNVPEEELSSIETEIRLLEKLNHSNIVKYMGTMRTENTMNIILEFVESGSLQGLMRKYGGSFPEPLVSFYISQVLEGLEYLHEQGVIHRDIKGANILYESA